MEVKYDIKYEEYKELDTVEKVAFWVIKNKVGIYGTTKTLLYQGAFEAVSGNLFYRNIKFKTLLEWATYVSSTTEQVVNYIIENDKCLVPIFDR